MGFLSFGVVVWLAITSAVVGLALYRKLVSRYEDDSIHVSPGDNTRVAQQVALAHRLDAVDKWGKGLTVVAVVLGILLVAISVYETWMASLKLNP